MTLTQIVQQWNASAQALQQQPTATAKLHSMQVRTGISAGNNGFYNTGYDTPTPTMVRNVHYAFTDDTSGSDWNGHPSGY